MLEIRAALRKAPKAGLHVSGDSFDLVERPRGGLSVIVADGQGSGEAAKRMSGIVVARAANMIAEGARDGAVARAVHDFLYALRGGKVLCTLAMVSVDLNTGTVVISRNTQMPVLLKRTESAAVEYLDRPVEPIGVQEQLKPRIRELPLKPGMTVVAFTDGVTNAGKRQGNRTDMDDFSGIVADYATDPDQLAQRLFDYIMERSAGRPDDDVTVVVVGVRERESRSRVRSLRVNMPFRMSDIKR